MPLYVLEMSTDADIRATTLASGWPAVTTRFPWASVQTGGWNLPQGSTIIVVAHGNNDEIGNATPGTVDVTPAAFLALVHSGMANGAMPEAVYVSACSHHIAGFAAQVRLLAQDNAVWHRTRIFGHSEAIAGPVPSPTALGWYEIC